ncbi:MAG TPA: hypothetical protein VN648_03115, partial [Candidatus Methylomirabilis sp.]|nr:hypothetical protein [Candidatus Methylomirabilis sp.]
MFLYYALVFMSPFYHHPYFDRGPGTLTLVKLVGFACTLFALFYLGATGSIPRYLGSRQAILFLAITLVAFISYAAHPSMRAWSDEPAFSYLSFLAFFFVTLTLADTVKKIWWAVMA